MNKESGNWQGIRKHASGSLRQRIQSRFQFFDSGLIVFSTAKQPDDFNRCAELVQRLNSQHVDGFNGLDAFVGILLQQGLQYGSCLIAVFSEVVSLPDVLRSLTACQGRLVEGDMADQIERVEVFANLFSKFGEEDTVFFQFSNDGFFLIGG